VRDAKAFRDVGGRLRRPGAAKDFQNIVRRLSEGEELLRRHYRARIDDPKSPDPLLEKYGIKHLHLVQQNSDIILYCIEYRSLVLLLQVSGHVHLDAEPPGKELLPSLTRELVELSSYQREGQAVRSLGIWLGIARKK
jgi:hypothetical protein